MFKIGDFSKLSKVSVKALRYYDELGLLKPATIDRFTGYRYYSAHQLPRLNRILALKDLGFSLEQIGQLLNEELPAEQIRGMLKLKRAEIQQLVEEEQARLARVEARLRQIEQEDTMPDYEVILKRLEPMTVASLREVVPTYPDVGRLHGELDRYFREHGVHEVSACLSVYHDQEYKERDVDAEAAFPIEPGMLQGNDRVKIRELPGVDMAACVVHRGPYDSLNDAYSAVMSWIEAYGYRVAGSDCEVYLHNIEHTTKPEA